MNAESVKARLKNIAVKDGGTMQDKLITYALERSIYRLSVSKYVDRFTLNWRWSRFCGNKGDCGSCL